MLLNLLRVEQLRVEDMMKRSFAEFHNQKDEAAWKERLQKLTKHVETLPEVGQYLNSKKEYRCIIVHVHT